MFHNVFQPMFHGIPSANEMGNEIGTKSGWNESGTNRLLKQADFVPSEIRSGPISFRFSGSLR